MTPSAMNAELRQTQAASKELRLLPRTTKDAVLMELARLIEHESVSILEANARDDAALPADATHAFRDRLRLDGRRLASIVTSLKQIAALDDPVGESVEERTLSNGLKIRRVRAPLGVIFMIFESRPNVAIEAFSLAFKAGNVAILRGGKESTHTTTVFYDLIERALGAHGVHRRACWGIRDSNREIVGYLLQQRKWIDIVVPRGGDSLIDFVVKNSHIPVIKNDRGLCHVYVHADADLGMAAEIVINAKTQRPGVCNAMETLLVHQQIAGELLPRLHERMPALSWRADPLALSTLGGAARVAAATAQDWDTEHLDLIVNCRVVPTLDEAIRHIEQHGSRHSESIVTASETTARRFQSEVDAAAVYWNASTRFTDGFELGLGGELGISTQKLHVRGPVGLRELTSARWIIDGTGQVRGS